MTVRGSVLIVVLGLLAILAVVGIAYVTMSTIDRSTAANFALQAQFDLAADAALDYVCQDLIQDVWEFDDSATGRDYTGFLLRIKDPVTLDPKAWPKTNTCEPWDYPDPTAPTVAVPGPDLWLAANVTNLSAPVPCSYRTASAVSMYGIASGFGGDAPTKTIQCPDNLGIPGNTADDPQPNGLWVPELAFPYESGIIRVSVTVQDHCALINLNAHGNKASAAPWKFSGGASGTNIGYGYFISDVKMPLDWSDTELGYILAGTTIAGGQVPGRWGFGSAAKPKIENIGEALIENPKDSVNRAFTLDEEFELRNLRGTYWTSRIENAASSKFKSDPATAKTFSTPQENRLKFTTVGWVADVMGDGTTLSSRKMWNGFSKPKVDLNTGSDADISDALRSAAAFPWTEGDQIKQFVANIKGFREKPSSWGAPGYSGKTGAIRQPLFTRAKLEKTGVVGGNEVWKLTLEVYNPWAGDWAGDTGGILADKWQIKLTGSLAGLSPSSPKDLGTSGTRIAEKTCVTVANTTFTFNCPPSSIGSALTAVDLYMKNPSLKADTVDISKLIVSGSGKDIYRNVGVYYDETVDLGGGTIKNTILHVTGGGGGSDWVGGTRGTDWGNVNAGGVGAGTAIPIRFPRSVPSTVPVGGFGPGTTSATEGYRAFRRVGDLNQVLCPKDDAEATLSNWWPWLPRVAKAAATVTDERFLKFNWKGKYPDDPSDPPPTSITDVCRANASNVLCVGGPWIDGLDNDMDGSKDNTETAVTDATGRYAGPEFRVAGKINLNTATQTTRDALFAGVALTITPYSDADRDGLKGFKSPAHLLYVITGNADVKDVWGPLEKRDLPYTRISNIASVRSDTFSIYGTVQYVYPPTAGTLVKPRIAKSRRFWALVDRSPTLAFPPSSGVLKDGPGAPKPEFIRPRILNFQWID
jgi:hypothetical protein